MFTICDEHGNKYDGVYLIELLVWNKGNQAIRSSDFTPSLPFKVLLSDDAKIITVRTMDAHDSIKSDLIIENNSVVVNFDAINPNESFLIAIFISGNPRASISVSGKVIGQEEPIDHTYLESRASIGERVLVSIILLWILLSIPGLLISGYFIFDKYGVDVFLNGFDGVSHYLSSVFSVSIVVPILFVYSKVSQWYERSKYPEDHLLISDTEPPLFETIKGMLKCVFKGDKQRISTSIFDFGEPVIMAQKKIRRRTTDDWMY